MSLCFYNEHGLRKLGNTNRYLYERLPFILMKIDIFNKVFRKCERKQQERKETGTVVRGLVSLLSPGSVRFVFFVFFCVSCSAVMKMVLMLCRISPYPSALIDISPEVVPILI